MATSFLGRALISKPTFASLVARSFTSSSLARVPSVHHRLRFLIAGKEYYQPPAVTGVRYFSTHPNTSSLNDPSPNWSNRLPKETFLDDGCDFEHWLVVMEHPDENATRDDIIDSYIKTLAEVVGSEDDARKKIYSVSSCCYFAFGCLGSEELSYKIKGMPHLVSPYGCICAFTSEDYTFLWINRVSDYTAELPKVSWVVPDAYWDRKNKVYAGEPFIDGKAVPYDPKYHEEWIGMNACPNKTSRRNDRPQIFEWLRTHERLVRIGKEWPKVSWVLPDSYLDVKNKDYGGEPFIDGKVVPYDPKYHEVCGVQNNPTYPNQGPGGELTNPGYQNQGVGGAPPANPVYQIQGVGGVPPANPGYQNQAVGGAPPVNPGYQNQVVGGAPPVDPVYISDPEYISDWDPPDLDITIEECKVFDEQTQTMRFWGWEMVGHYASLECRVLVPAEEEQQDSSYMERDIQNQVVGGAPPVDPGYQNQVVGGAPPANPVYQNQGVGGVPPANPGYQNQAVGGAPPVDLGYQNQVVGGAPPANHGYQIQGVGGVPLANPGYQNQAVGGAPPVNPGYQNQVVRGAPPIDPGYISEWEEMPPLDVRIREWEKFNELTQNVRIGEWESAVDFWRREELQDPSYM